MTDEMVVAPEGKAMPKEKSEFFTHLEAAGDNVVKQWSSLIPKEFWSYGREAQREFLYAMRTLVDHAIEFVDDANGEIEVEGEAPRKATKRSTKKVKVEVE